MERVSVFIVYTRTFRARTRIRSRVSRFFLCFQKHLNIIAQIHLQLYCNAEDGGGRVRAHAKHKHRNISGSP